MKVLHFITDNFYINDFVESIKNQDSDNDYILLCIRKRRIRFLNINHTQISIFEKEYRYLGNKLDQYDRVIVHFLTPTVARFLLSYAKECKIIMIFWGGEFYFLPRFYNQIYYSFSKKYSSRKRLIILDSIRRIFFLPSYKDVELFYQSQLLKYFAHYIQGDYKNYINVFPQNLRLEYVEFAYQEFITPSIFPIINQKKIKPFKEINIQLGNSADPGNNHYEALLILKGINEKFTIFCPLSYGDRKYSNNLKKYGANLFGNRFVPLETFLSKKQYFDNLETIDVAIFPNPYQQGAGNAIQLVGMGKTVYLDSRNTLKLFFEQLGIVVFDIANLSKKKQLEFITHEQQKLNIEKISLYFSNTNKLERVTRLFTI